MLLIAQPLIDSICSASLTTSATQKVIFPSFSSLVFFSPTRSFFEQFVPIVTLMCGNARCALLAKFFLICCERRETSVKRGEILLLRCAQARATGPSSCSSLRSRSHILSSKSISSYKLLLGRGGELFLETVFFVLFFPPFGPSDVCS